MGYRIMVSNGYETNYFYNDNRDEAELLYTMAINSKMFAYVQISKLKGEYIPKEEWCEE